MLWKNERDRFGGEGRSERGYSGPLLTLTNVITLDGLRLGGVLQHVSVFKRKEPLYSGSCQVSSLASILLGKESSSAFVRVSLASPPARAHTAKAERQLASISRLALMSKTQLISKCFHYWYHIKEGVRRRIWVWYTFMCILFLWNTSPLLLPRVILHLLAYAVPAALETRFKWSKYTVLERSVQDCKRWASKCSWRTEGKREMWWKQIPRAPKKSRVIPMPLTGFYNDLKRWLIMILLF